LHQVGVIQCSNDIPGNAFGRVVFHDESVFAVFDTSKGAARTGSTS
jgi:hypothetical protein